MEILILAALDKEISVLNKLINAETKDGFCFAKINNLLNTDLFPIDELLFCNYPILQFLIVYKD